GRLAASNQGRANRCTSGSASTRAGNRPPTSSNGTNGTPCRTAYTATPAASTARAGTSTPNRGRTPTEPMLTAASASPSNATPGGTGNPRSRNASTAVPAGATVRTAVVATW